jgi:hypothetical protein
MLKNALFSAAGASLCPEPPRPFITRIHDVLATIRNFYQSDDRLIVTPSLEANAIVLDLSFEEICLPLLSLSVSRVGYDDCRFTLQYIPASPMSIELYIFHSGRKVKAANDIAWTGTHWRPVSFSVFLDECSHAEFVHSALKQAGLLKENFRRLRSIG